jgi:thiol-disulfide isomerase/thioredoxin
MPATRLEANGIFPAGLPVGTAAPNFDLLRPGNQTVNLRTLFADDKLVMLVFIDPDCDPCKSLLPEINYWAARYSDSLTISVITRDDRQADHLQSVHDHVANVLLQDRREVAEAFGVAGFPTAVIVRPDGVISSRLALGAEAIRALLADIVGMLAIKSMPHFVGTGDGSLPQPIAAAKSGCGTCGH